VMVLSVGALLNHPDLAERARETGGQIIVPTGALLGLDAVAAAAEGVIYSVRMKTTRSRIRDWAPSQPTTRLASSSRSSSRVTVAVSPDCASEATP